jgi:uncharacterized repeat protein (TIGR01451 family)
MKAKIIFLLLGILLIFSSVKSYANRVEIDPVKGSLLNGPIQCNTENPIPFTTASFDNLTTSSSTSGLCLVGCGISNVTRLTDTNLTNFATATTTIGLGVIHRLRSTDTNDIFAAGNFAGYRIAPNGGVLSVDLLNNISITTYLGGVARQSVSGASLINISLLANPGNYILGFNTTQTFDAIEISISSLVGASTSTNIYYAVIRNYCAGPDLACNTPTALNLPAYPAVIEYNHSGLSGVGIGTISNPENAVSSSATDYAALTLTAGVLASARLSIKDQIADYPSGTYAGFEIENINLVTASALSNIQVTTYLNGVQRDQFSGSNLIVNGTLLNASGHYKLGFVSALSFDEVQLSVNQVIGFNLGTTKIYSAVFEKFCPGALPCNTPTVLNAPAFPVYIDGVKTGINGIACLLCSVTGSENLIDTDALNYANVDLTASVGTAASIAVKDQITDYPAGTFAGFDIEGIALLNANVLDALRVTTFLNGAQQETKFGNGPLISVNTNLLISTGRATIGFAATLPFDEAQLSLVNLATVTLGTVRVYSGVFEKFCPATVACNQTYALTNPSFPVIVDTAKSGISGAVCAACAVNNTNNVLTPSISDFANITITGGVLASGAIAVADQLFTYPPGTITGFTIKDINNLIELDLFQSLTISTYNNGSLQESKTGAQLLSLSLLTPILGNGPGYYNVGYKATLPFDEIRIRVGSLASVISNVNVYGAFVNTKDSNDGGAGSLSCLNADLRIVKTVSNATPPIGTNIVFTIAATNDGPRDADGVVVNDVVPAGYSYISSTVSTGSFNNITGVWSIGNLANGATAILTITVRVNAAGNYANTATVTGNQPDPNPGNNTSTSTPVPVSVIIANDDNGNIVNGFTGGTAFTNVLTNDTLNGQPVTGSQVNTTFVSATNAGITLSGTNVLVAAGTPAGPYTLTYQICEVAHPTNCDQAVVSVTVTAPVIDAVNDTAAPINGYTGGTFTNVLANDTLNGQPVIASQVNTTFVSSTNAGITLSGTNVLVAAGTPAGTYSLVYRICEITNPTNCDQATVSITVTAPIIDAVNDTAAPINGYTGGTFTNVLANDTLNGQPVIASQVNTSFVSSTNPGITLSGTNVLVAAGTPAGSYSLVYRICEITNPTNCDQATVSITVIAPIIDAVNDTAAPINGYTGGTFTNVLANDTLNGQPVIASQVNTSFVSSTNAGITLSGTNVLVAAGTPSGSYSLIYRICQIANPTNCDQATVFVTVTAPIIDAVNDTGASVNSATGGTSFTNVLGNDTLNGQPVIASQVNTTFVSSTNPGITLSGTNVLVAAGTPAGSYTLTYKICQVTNPTNCDQAVVSVTVTCATPAAPTVSATQPDCTTATGTITITAPLGLMYSINGSIYQSGTVFSGLSAATYNVTVKNGTCVSAATVVIINGSASTPAAPTISITQSTCTNATATITITAPLGSTLTYSINGSTYQAATSFSGLTLGSYNVTVKNGNCVSAATVAVINAAPATPASPTVSVTQPNCTTATGSITITAPLGSGLTYSVNGSTYQSGTAFSGLASGSYNVTVKNGACISAPTAAVINAGPTTPAAPTISITQPTCMVPTGTITITAPTGSGLTYSLNGTAYQSGTSFTGLTSGSYSVTVRNASCTSAATTVTVNGAPSTCNTAGIFHTVVTCSDFRNDAGSQLVGQLCYATRSGKVSNVTPGQFFYYTTVTAPSASFCIDITETKSCAGLALFAIQQSNQLNLYNASCGTAASGTQVSLGLGRVCVSNAVPGAMYVLSVKYDSKSVVGAAFTGTAPVCQYSFQSSINGTMVPGSAASINMVPNCTVTRTMADDIESFDVTLAPNPAFGEFGLKVQGQGTESIGIRVIDIDGRLIREIHSEPADTIYFGNDLKEGFYFIEVRQGDQRTIVKAHKM